MQDLLSVHQAAARCGVAAKTLANWRVRGAGPRFIKAGARVGYDPADIEEWKSGRRVGSTSEAVSA